MPPVRRRGGNPAASRAQQSTLSFGSKSRVTKPSAAQAPSKKLKDVEPIVDNVAADTRPADTVEPDQVPVTPPVGSSKPHIAEVVVSEQAKAEVEQPLSEEDKEALKITDADLKRYWEEKEAERKAPRDVLTVYLSHTVHQEDLSLHEKILRHFDLSTQYGPCIGIARLKRWRRAKMLDLNPPIEVLAVLLKEQNKGVQQRAICRETGVGGYMSVDSVTGILMILLKTNYPVVLLHTVFGSRIQLLHEISWQNSPR
ncbi:putative DNA polymerase delta subunit 4 [Thermoascus aurantiacus ATCC 26904]